MLCDQDRNWDGSDYRCDSFHGDGLQSLPSLIFSYLTMQRPLEYIRVWSDDAGESHIETASIAVQSERFAPPAPPLGVSALSRAAGWNLLRFAADWVGGWHCTPSRQWMFLLAGQATVRVSDGSQCDLSAGSICLLEDTRGKGHLTTIIGGDEVLIVAIRIPDA